MILKSVKQLCVMIAMLVVISVFIPTADAWERNCEGVTPEVPDRGEPSDEMPCEGELYWEDRSGNIVRTIAYGIQWDWPSLESMRDDSDDEVLDMTMANWFEDGCEWGQANIIYNRASTDMPNNGFGIGRDCGLDKTEVELRINPDSIYTNRDYYYYVDWECEEITQVRVDITFEASNSRADRNRGWLSSEEPNCTSTRSSQKVTAQTNEPVALETIVLQEGTFETYNYTVYQTGEHVSVNVNTSYSIDENLQNISDVSLEWLENRKDDSQSDSLLVNVTFNSPFSYQNATDFVSGNDIQVIDYTVYGTDNNGVVSTYYPSQEGRIEPFADEEIIDKSRILINDGIMNMTVLVSEETLSTIQSLPNVELVDLTANAIQQQLLDETGVEVSLENISMPNPSWMVYSDSVNIEQPTSVNVQSLLTKDQPTQILFSVTLMVILCLAGISVKKSNID